MLGVYHTKDPNGTLLNYHIMRRGPIFQQHHCVSTHLCPKMHRHDRCLRNWNLRWGMGCWRIAWPWQFSWLIWVNNGCHWLLMAANIHQWLSMLINLNLDELGYGVPTHNYGEISTTHIFVELHCSSQLWNWCLERPPYPIFTPQGFMGWASKFHGTRPGND